MTVLVTGPAGTTSSAVLAQLIAEGVSVRAVTRSPRSPEELGGADIDVVVASAEDPVALRDAFAGVSAAYLATPSHPTMAATEGAYARAAAEAGAHLVKLSVIGASADAPLRFARMHAEAEDAIVAAMEPAGGTWTFVQPTGFMQNDLVWAQQLPSGTIAGPVMDAAWSIVDVTDVAAVAVAALIDPAAHAGRRIAITGPEARTPRDRVRALAEVLGRDLAVVDLSVPDTVGHLRGLGVPGWEADGLGELFALYASGAAAGVAPDAEQVIGRPTRTWEAFVHDNLARFTG